MSSNNYIETLAAVAEEAWDFDGGPNVEDVTDELGEIEDDETEDEEVLRALIESAPLTLEEVSQWIRDMTRNERQHWDQWVRDLRGYANAIIALGFNPGNVQHYLARNEP